MNRYILEKYLGKRIKVKLFDNKIIEGELHKTGEQRFKNNPNLYYPHNFYVLLGGDSNIIFRVSHVKSIKED